MVTIDGVFNTDFLLEATVLSSKWEGRAVTKEKFSKGTHHKTAVLGNNVVQQVALTKCAHKEKSWWQKWIKSS